MFVGCQICLCTGLNIWSWTICDRRKWNKAVTNKRTGTVWTAACPPKKPNTSSERACGADCWDDSSYQDNLGSCTEEKWRNSPLLGAIKDSVTIGWRRDHLWPCCQVEVSPLNQMNATHFSWELFWEVAQRDKCRLVDNITRWWVSFFTVHKFW